MTVDTACAATAAAAAIRASETMVATTHPTIHVLLPIATQSEVTASLGVRHPVPIGFRRCSMHAWTAASSEECWPRVASWHRTRRPTS